MTTHDPAGTVESATISAAGISVTVIELGASLMAVRVPDRDGGVANVVLALATSDDYRDRPRNPHLGAMVGRYANRIAGAAVTIDGVTHELAANEGANILHGGAQGWSRRPWTIVRRSTDAVTLRLESPDGDAGFPGAVLAEVTYSVGPARLEIEATATVAADAAGPTPISMTNHAYWNLTGSGSDPGGTSAVDHVLAVALDHYLPVETDPALKGIPTGEIAAVDGTVFDLRGPTTPIPELDHCLVDVAALGRERGEQAIVRPVATLSDPSSGRTVTLSTDQPGLQVYGAQHLGDPFVARGAVCLEPQQLPDAPHRPAFGDTLVAPGGAYRFRAVYDFAVSA